MDTVTEARLAIAIAQEGGIGIVHKNLTPAAAGAEVARVKRYESGVLRDPITIARHPGARSGRPVSSSTASRASRCSRARWWWASSPTATCASRPAGRAGARDHDPARAAGHRARRRHLEEGKALMHQHKLERVLVVNDAFELRGLMTVKDITKQTDFPNAARDAARQAARGRGGGRGRRHRGARRGCWPRPASTPGGRHRPRPQRRRDRARSLGQANFPQST
jgi:IMP dehydrogenase